MSTAQIVSIVISIAAFLVAAYGIIERRIAATRSERIRLTTIVENLTQVRRELVELGQQGKLNPNLTEVIKARLEVLGQQALSLIQQHSLTITSTECREISIGLEETGYREDAEFAWELARDRAKKEGDTQELYASRGYAYFLFRSERVTEAREILQEALSSHPTDTDAKRVAHAETLQAWAVWEAGLEGSNSQMVVELNKQLDDLRRTLSTQYGRLLFDSVVGGVTRASIENPQP